MSLILTDFSVRRFQAAPHAEEDSPQGMFYSSAPSRIHGNVIYLFNQKHFLSISLQAELQFITAVSERLGSLKFPTLDIF